jgi:hypothetical protein
MVRPGSPGAQIAPQLRLNPDLRLDSGALLATFSAVVSACHHQDQSHTRVTSFNPRGQALDASDEVVVLGGHGMLPVLRRWLSQVR